MKTITIVIPAFNEGTRIVKTLQAVQEIAGINKIIVVNDGSTDNTAEIVKELNIDIINLKTNVGKGGAMNASLSYIDTDIVVFLDADLGSSANEAIKIIKPVAEGEADLCIAAFPPAQRKGGFGLVKGTAAKAIKRAGAMEVNAPLSGQRAMTKEVLMAVTPFSQAYGVELSMTITALRKGFRVIEVPTNMQHNETGRNLSGFIHRGKQFLDVLKVIIHEKRGK
ncbi:MAG TPA: glycosyltransferase family 2 protein [Syntrophomonadaceae bacterium]|nr:glycosyltransferase family 2 protein [Syntrophomonadaceae bacterium]